MNKSEFITLIENPESLGKEQVSALKEIAADFPYFQSVQILLAKALFNQNHYEFEKQLKHTALVVPDREVLYRFMNHTQVAKEGEKVAVSVIPEVTLPVIENEISVKQEEENTITIPSSEIIAPILHEEPEVLPETAADITLTPVEEIIQEELPTPPVIVVEPVIVEQNELVPVLEEQVIEPVAEEIEVIQEPEPEVEKVEKKEESPESIETHKNEIHSFSEWLQLTRTGHVPVEPAPEKKPEEKEHTEPVKEEPIKVEVTQEPAAKPVEHKSNIQELESLLDRFIKESPSISRPKAEFYSPQNMAKQSIEEDEDLVTETLANVYYKQGNYKKAIRAYEKLCLIYPHKMAYFADLIRKIKQEVKD